jgi:hypothetical protein
MKQHALIGTKGIFGTILYNSATPMRQLLDEDWTKFQTKYGIKLPASTRIVRVEADVNLIKF